MALEHSSIYHRTRGEMLDDAEPRIPTIKPVPSQAPTFDPTRYLKPLNGKQYLEVVHRLQWLRSEHADALITTRLEQVDFTAGWAIFHARVEIPGRGIAEGTGSETRAAFPAGWLEKAETIAIGRALAALGYGTAFCLDFETVDESGAGHLADSPIVKREPTPIQTNAATVQSALQPTAYQRITDAQRRLIFVTASRDRGMSDDELEAVIQERYGKALMQLSKIEASAVIDFLKTKEARRG